MVQLYRDTTRNHKNVILPLDFDGDGNADLLLTTNDNIEFWRNTGTDKEIKQKFKNDKNISYPMNCTTNNCEIGQVCYLIVISHFKNHLYQSIN